MTGSLLRAGLLLGWVMLGCGQGEGDRCEIDSDCNEGFCDVVNGNGICRLTPTLSNGGAGGTVTGTGGAVGASGGASGGDAAPDVKVDALDAAVDATTDSAATDGAANADSGAHDHGG